MLVRMVVAPARDDAGLRLEGDPLPLRRAQAQRFGEPAFAQVETAAGVADPVDVGVVEEVDPGLAGGGVQLADLLVGLVGDPHHPRDDVGHPGVGGSEGDGLHGFLSWGPCPTGVGGESTVLVEVEGAMSVEGVHARPRRCREDPTTRRTPHPFQFERGEPGYLADSRLSPSPVATVSVWAL